jgi:arylsulfatase A-like enzyme
MLSCYGQKHFRTPNIDRIAGEGVRFTNFYGCIFCAPARASLLTGLHDCHRGTWTFTNAGLYEKLSTGEIELNELTELLHTTGLQAGADDVFLPEVARQAGYVTAEIGKLEWGFATTAARVKRHGWDYHYGYYDHQRCHGFYPPFLWENGEMVTIAGNTHANCGKAPQAESPRNREIRWDRTGKAVYSQDLFDQKLLEFVRANRDRPFFLFHPSQLPHGPICVPEIDPAVADKGALSQYEKEYASMVLRLDRTVGMLLDELERLGIDDNTMFVFSSDNGHAVYYREQGRCEPGRNMKTGETYDNITTKMYSELSGDVFNGNDSMAGSKFTCWEGGPRIPFMVRWPGRVSPGKLSDKLVANYDFMTTVAEVTGTPAPGGKDGISFLPELLGTMEPQQTHEHIVFASHQGPAIVDRDGWKLRFIRLPKENLYQLYHLPEDYREERNIVHDAPEEVNRLCTQLLMACDGNFHNGTAEAHRIWLPGWNYYGPDCPWQMR